MQHSTHCKMKNKKCISLQWVKAVARVVQDGNRQDQDSQGQDRQNQKSQDQDHHEDHQRDGKIAERQSQESIGRMPNVRRIRRRRIRKNNSSIMNTC